MNQILLVACYELGHQPLSLAWPVAVLLEAGYSASTCDLAVESLDDDAIRQADFVGIAAPMHTAMRLGVEVARRVRGLNPQAHLCFFGLYGWLNADYLLGRANSSAPAADSVIGGEYEASLHRLVDALARGQDPATVPGVSLAEQRAPSHLERYDFPLPDRSDLPSLDHYAHYVVEGRAVPAGYVESSRGCLHTCRHCPVVPVYGGRFFVVPQETVIADIRQQVQAGAGHITFGDPDFLNGPGHVMKIARALHEEFPGVTFDFTTKVEHILERRGLFPELRELGASFVVSAFETTSDRVLARLKKGHTVADMDEALAILEEAGLHVQPAWLPFTPWTTLDDYLEMLQWIRHRGLIQNVPAVQLSIRLLVPPRSALLEHEDVDRWLGPLDAGNYTYEWQHPDPRMDRLQRQVARLAEERRDGDPYDTFSAVERLAYETAGQTPPGWERLVVPDAPPPRLTEDWFC